jgi:hypothetical protein
MLRQVSMFMRISSKVSRYAAFTIRRGMEIHPVISSHPRLFSSKVPNEKSSYDSNHPYRSLFKIIWKNAISDLPVLKGTRRCSKNEMWWMISSEGNESYRCITKKIDPDLGDIAKLIVANANHLADMEREGSFSSVLSVSDKMFHDEMSDLHYRWQSIVNKLLEEKVINKDKIENPTSDEDISVYNINIMIEKYYHDLYKLMEKEDISLQKGYFS